MNTVKQNYIPLRILNNDNTKILKFYPIIKTKHIQTDKLCIPTLEGNIYLPTKEIFFCRANGSYTIIHTTNKKPILVSKALKWVQERLSKAEFIRVHHSYIVQKEVIENSHFSIRSSITLSDKTIIPVARSRKHYVKSILA